MKTNNENLPLWFWSSELVWQKHNAPLQSKSKYETADKVSVKLETVPQLTGRGQQNTLF